MMNFTHFEITMLVIVVFIAVLSLFNAIVLCCKKEPENSKPTKVVCECNKRMPKYYINADVKIRENVFNEFCLGWKELIDHKDDTFKVVDVFNSVDRGISYKIKFERKLTPGTWQIVEYVVPEHYLYWACEDVTTLYADGRPYCWIFDGDNWTRKDRFINA